MKKLFIAVTLALTGGLAQAQSGLAATDTRAVPTYESVGLYWANPGANAVTGCEVKYRRAGDNTWKQGLAMWFDVRNNECRGSVVSLTQDTSYEVQFNLPGVAPMRATTFRTWPNQRPVLRTVTVASGAATLNITQGGSPSGYVVYQGAPGATLDALNASPYNVSVNASYVIVRGLILKGAQQDGIRIAPNVTDVIIEDNEITGWGRQRSGIYGVEHDSAVHAVCSSPTLERVTVQRNEIHDPRYTANSWSDGHPQGPQGITLTRCGGNHVIRHNEIFSTTGRYYNDIIGGGNNDSNTGFPNADTDIHGNDLSHAWDDAIEAEGGNRNVRVWGNYINQTGTGVASTPTATGPIYMFRNVYNRSRMLEKSPLDQDDRQVMFKAGAYAEFGDGRRYIFHNTMLQATQAGTVYGLGAAGGISGTGAGRLINNTVSRNNIFHNWRTWTAYYDVGVGNDFANDLYNGSAGAAVVSGITGTPIYAAGNGWTNEAGGQYQLASSSPGFDKGARIANFNDAFSGAAPDVGAHEAATGAMKFGIAASPGSAVAASQPAPKAARTRTDLNGDGKSDLLYRNGTTGQVYRYLVNGLALTHGATVHTEPNTAWKVVGDADFNGDGVTDLLWRNAPTGQVTVMLLNAGGTPGASGLVTTEPDPAWKIVQTPDLDGDGKSDLLWRNDTTGQVYAMLMNGAAIGVQGFVYTEPNRAWKIEAVGDLAGSGKSNQLVWRNGTTGQVYLMTVSVANGAFSPSGVTIYTEPNTAWKVFSATDFNGDGKSDLLWKNDATGQVFAMLMNGDAIAGQGMIHQEPDPAWKVVAQGDYNGDGKSDLLWRNETTGQVYMMLMNGVAIASQGMVYQEPNTAWKLLGPWVYAN